MLITGAGLNASEIAPMVRSHNRIDTLPSDTREGSFLQVKIRGQSFAQELCCNLTGKLSLHTQRDGMLPSSVKAVFLHLWPISSLSRKHKTPKLTKWDPHLSYGELQKLARIVQYGTHEIILGTFVGNNPPCIMYNEIFDKMVRGFAEEIGIGCFAVFFSIGDLITVHTIYPVFNPNKFLCQLIWLQCASSILFCMPIFTISTTGSSPTAWKL